MSEQNKLPFIGWKACEERFYLDALPISESEVYQYLKEGTAIIMPNAKAKLDEMIGQFPLIASAMRWAAENPNN